jgi:hypothetical protein
VIGHVDGVHYDAIAGAEFCYPIRAIKIGHPDIGAIKTQAGRCFAGGEGLDEIGRVLLLPGLQNERQAQRDQERNEDTVKDVMFHKRRMKVRCHDTCLNVSAELVKIDFISTASAPNSTRGKLHCLQKRTRDGVRHTNH